jgi:hypothetical protein
MAKLSDSPSKPKTDISKIGKQSVTPKIPEMKKPADAFAPLSVFFKSEYVEPKHKNLKKLWDFIQKKHKTQQKQ